MQPLRILQVIEFFTPQMGGSVQVAYQAARHLARKGHHIVICTSDFGKDDARFPETPFEIIRFRSLLKRWKFYITPGLIPWARKHLREFDIIHLHNVRTFQNAVLAAQARKIGIPYILSAHGSLPHLNNHQAVKRASDILFGHRLVQEANQLIAVSEVEVNQYLEAGISKEKISIIHNGLDLDEFISLPERGTFRQKFQITSQVKLVLFIGRLHKIKGVDILIEALAHLKTRMADVVLVIAGPDDGELPVLQEMVTKLGLAEQVIFTGSLFGYDKLAAYVDADVLASPSVYEIFGLVPFEAIMCGTPVVVTDDCGSGQIINKAQAGYTVAFGDVEALSKSLQYVLSNPLEAKQKVSAGQKFIQEHLDWESIVIQLINLYQDCIQDHELLPA
jgi:glycosyltransferase involved in cell wall biosynthesis